MANMPDPTSGHNGASTTFLVVNQVYPTTSQGNYSQFLGLESLPLTITTQPEITHGISPPYYAPFQHMSRSNPTILFPNSSEFLTPPNIGGISQTPVTYNPPPLARE